MISFINVSFRYKSKQLLFSDLDFSLKEGLVYGLLGKNGAGKTTLLKLMTGLLFSCGGSIKIAGESPRNRSALLGENVFFIPDEIYLPPLSISKFLKIYSSLYPRFDHALFDNIVQTFEVSQKGLLSALSYGQKKKLLIAFGLSARTQVLLMDEPTNGLDIPSKTQFKNLVSQTFDPKRITIISTHQVHDVANLLQTIIIMDKGRILFNEPCSAISSVLQFCKQTQPDQSAETLYNQQIPEGYCVVRRNKQMEPSPIDCEVLFNAVVEEPLRVVETFNRWKAVPENSITKPNHQENGNV